MQKRKWLYVGLAVVLLGVAGFMFFGRSQNNPTYRFDQVSRGDISLTISATGTLNADTTVQVGSQVSGRIAKLYADYNSTVRQGQLLAQIDATFLQAAVDQQKAAVLKAQAILSDSKRSLDRTESLYKRQLAAQADLDAAMTTYESNKASYQQAEAALEQAEVNLRYTAIRAPIDGVVISRNVDVGQTVAASLQAPTLFTIANDLRKMQVQANVDEADIGNVKVGQDVSFRVDAFPTRTFRGRVMLVRLAPTVTQNVVMYTVIISVANQDLALMPGMTATVSILVAQRENALRVPIQAVRFTPPDAADQNGSPQPGRRTGGSGVGARPQGSRDGGSQGADSARAQLQQGQGGRTGRGARPDSAGTDPQVPDDAGRNSTLDRVWIMQGDKPVALMIRGGLQNDRYVEVVQGNLQEGENVIVGMSTSAGGQSSSGQNPFGPQRIGGGRRGF